MAMIQTYALSLRPWAVKLIPKNAKMPSVWTSAIV